MKEKRSELVYKENGNAWQGSLVSIISGLMAGSLLTVSHHMVAITTFSFSLRKESCATIVMTVKRRSSQPSICRVNKRVNQKKIEQVSGYRKEKGKSRSLDLRIDTLSRHMPKEVRSRELLIVSCGYRP